jgi:hypothetical protein
VLPVITDRVGGRAEPPLQDKLTKKLLAEMGCPPAVVFLVDSGSALERTAMSLTLPALLD